MEVECRLSNAEEVFYGKHMMGPAALNAQATLRALLATVTTERIREEHREPVGREGQSVVEPPKRTL